MSVEWTRIEDGTPDDDVPVLIAYHDLYIEAGTGETTICQAVAMIDSAWKGFKGDRLDFWTDWKNGSSMHPWDYKVTHWQPLPLLPTAS